MADDEPDDNAGALGRKWIARLHSTIAKFGEPAAKVGSDDYGGISGTPSVATKSKILDLMSEPVTGFVDLGSGLNDVVYTVAKFFPIIRTYGVEVSSVIVDHVNLTLPTICKQMEIDNLELFKRKEDKAGTIYSRRIRITRKNILEIEHLSSDVSHLYSFAKGMPEPVLKKICDLIIKFTSIRQAFLILSISNETTMREYFPDPMIRLSKHRATMRGSNRAFTLWVIERLSEE